MLNIKEQTKQRAKQVLFADKLVSPSQFKEALKVECYNMLSQFMVLDPQNLKLGIVVESTGEFKININATTKQIKPVGVVIR